MTIGNTLHCARYFMPGVILVLSTMTEREELHGTLPLFCTNPF